MDNPFDREKNTDTAAGRAQSPAALAETVRAASPLGIATLCAIACAAYLVADLAHEGLGHGGACLALGGRSLLLDSTFQSCSLRARLIDGAGPVMGILVAMLAWAWVRFAPPRDAGTRIFLVLVFAFAVFWNVGYMVKSGLFDAGDWAFVIAGLAPRGLWHAGLAAAGITFYAAAMRLLAASVVRALPAGEGPGIPPLTCALTAYLMAGALAAAGGFFDPRGPATILTDSLPSALGAIGLPWTGWILSRRLPQLRLMAPVSAAWIAAGAAATVFFVGVLGPGLRF